MINGISQFCHDYYDQIPVHSLKAVGLSAVTTFTASVLLFSDMENSRALDLRPFLGAGIAAVAAAIHALTIPIFNYIFDNNGIYNPYQEFAHTISCKFLTQILFNRVTAFNINLLEGDQSTLVNNFTVFLSCQMRMVADIMIRLIAYFNVVPHHVIGGTRHQIQSWGVNFNQTTPIYFVVDEFLMG